MSERRSSALAWGLWILSVVTSVAQRTVGAFALPLRDGVEPELVADDLLQVVDRMVEPSQTSLGMRRP